MQATLPRLVLIGSLAMATVAPAAAQRRIAIDAAVSTHDFTRTARPDPEAVVHLLQRATFGPTRAAVVAVRRRGIAAWVDTQLQPQLLQDPDLDERLELYPTLRLSTAELYASYQPANQGGDPERPPQRILAELNSARLVRAVHARAQLREVMVDFWANHFSVYAPDGPNRWTITDYERDRIRPHALGDFSDLLVATAQAPAMLRYLDNYLSVAAGSRGEGSGINENYARELLELHTLGVDGGYTQDDVVAVARALTGWTITPPRRTGTLEFVYVARFHDVDPKTVLGLPLTPGQIEEGLQVLELLATAPATAAFVASEITRHLLADDPPRTVVDAAAAVFHTTNGNIGAVVRAILLHPAFYEARYRGVKTKTPLELVASALRTMDADVANGFAAQRLVDRLGQPLWAARPPTGWPDDEPSLVSVSSMLDRFDAADRLAHGQLDGVSLAPDLWESMLVGRLETDRLLSRGVHRPASRATRLALRRAEHAGATPAVLGALALASPEFQRQ